MEFLFLLLLVCLVPLPHGIFLYWRSRQKLNSNGVTWAFPSLIWILFFCELLPLGLYAAAKLTSVQRDYLFSTIVVTVVGFLATIGVEIGLIRLAFKYAKQDIENKDPANVRGVFSVIFGVVAIILWGLLNFYSSSHLNMGAAEIMLLILFPAIFGFPLAGLILGVAGIRSRWGKIGIAIFAIILIVVLVLYILVKIEGG